MNQDQAWIRQCLDQIEDWGFAIAGASDREGNWSGQSLALRDQERTWSFRHLCVRQLRPSTTAYHLSNLLQEKSRFGDEAPWLLFTERVTESIGHLLRGQDVNYIDSSGNAWIRAPGLHVWIEGRRPRSLPKRQGGLKTPTALQLVFLLLKDGSWCNRPYRELATHSSLALGSIGSIMSSLIRTGQVIKKNGRRELSNPGKLLSNWEQQWHERLRPRLDPVLCKGKSDPGFERLIETCASREGWLIGGELAATRVAGDLQPTTATIHLPSNEIRECMKQLKLIQHPEGNIHIMGSFGQENEWDPHGPMPTSNGQATLVDPILMRAELLGSGDERLHSLADQLLETFIAPRWEI